VQIDERLGDYCSASRILGAMTSMESSSRLTRILLASGSPRRVEIMQGILNPVDSVRPTNVEGPVHPNESPADYVARMALEKSEAAPREDGGAVVLSADTMVVLDGRVLGKPEDADETEAMLADLRGRVHQVLTGVSVRNGSAATPVTEVTRTDVLMRDYSRTEIRAYAQAGSGLDKAGGYGIQDREFRPVGRIEGCYLNVVGLPLCTVVRLLSKVGANVQLQPRASVPYVEYCRGCDLRWSTEEQR
jgi:MAF protein|tara:strand:- start:2829 stop:3569 length:741 start_codon:yes stop_codon:yes gene_type:complete